jgi:hypothetical protein
MSVEYIQARQASNEAFSEIRESIFSLLKAKR